MPLVKKINKSVGEEEHKCESFSVVIWTDFIVGSPIQYAWFTSNSINWLK